MRLKKFTKRIFCCAMLAASVLTANAADRLLIVGDAVWGGYSIDNSIVMHNSDDAPDVFKATVHLDASKEFKFLTTTDWGGLEYRAGDEDVNLVIGVEGKLYSTEETSEDKKFYVSETANYDIVCDLQNGTIVVTKAVYQDNPVNHTGLWIVGGATPGEWSLSDALPMVQDAVNPLKFTAVVALKAGDFKFAVNCHTGFGQTFYLRDATDAEKIVFGGDDNKWDIIEDGTYNIAVDLLAMTISIEKHNPTSISSVAEDVNAPVEYYTLGGMKVINSVAGGVYVKRQGDKSVKVVMK